MPPPALLGDGIDPLFLERKHGNRVVVLVIDLTAVTSCK
jgi:hypothetical protein